MSDLLIPKDEWKQFFNEFSRRHEGSLVTIELFRADFRIDILEKSLPLKRIDAAPSQSTITVSAGDRSNKGIGYSYPVSGGTGITADRSQEGIKYTIDGPGGVRLFQKQDGTDDVLEIYADAGTFQVRLISTPDQTL